MKKLTSFDIAKISSKDINQGFDICSKCGGVELNGCMSDISDSDPDLICDDCRSPKVKVLFGDMTFFDEQIDERNETTVHCVRKIEMVDKDKLDVVCEEGLKTYEGYLIPDEYKGKITYEFHSMDLV
jgi:hypothetical protein